MSDPSTYSLHDLPEEDPDFIPKAEVIPFKMNPKGPKDKDWLSSLRDGTVFLTKPLKTNPVVYLERQVLNNRDKAILIKTMLIDATFYYEWVDPKGFCASQELVMIIREPKEEEDGKGPIQTNG